jgi:hypothetical protein
MTTLLRVLVTMSFLAAVGGRIPAAKRPCSAFAHLGSASHTYFGGGSPHDAFEVHSCEPRRTPWRCVGAPDMRLGDRRGRLAVFTPSPRFAWPWAEAGSFAPVLRGSAAGWALRGGGSEGSTQGSQRQRKPPRPLSPEEIAIAQSFISPEMAAEHTAADGSVDWRALSKLVPLQADPGGVHVLLEDDEMVSPPPLPPLSGGPRPRRAPRITRDGGVSAAPATPILPSPTESKVAALVPAACPRGGQALQADAPCRGGRAARDTRRVRLVRGEGRGVSS